MRKESPEPTKFKKWVRMYGGPERLAVDLGVTSFAVRHWLDRRGFAQVMTIRKIVKLSNGFLNFEDVIESMAPPEENKPTSNVKTILRKHAPTPKLAGQR